MIVTLAGHVDHGKTSLVRAITGVETDTLSRALGHPLCRRAASWDTRFAGRDNNRIPFS